jgi:excisionase family DNA binding protein
VSKKRVSKSAYKKTAAAALPPPGPEFVSKEIAAKRLRLSVRRVLELSERGLLKRRSVIDPVTKRRQTVFLAADVDRFVVEGQRRVVAYRGNAVGAGVVAALPPPSPAVTAAPLPERPWLTLEEASVYSGLPVSYLQKQIDDGCLAAIDVGVRPGGRYRVSRRDLDLITATRHTRSTA